MIEVLNYEDPLHLEQEVDRLKRERGLTTALIIPTYNEGANIGGILDVFAKLQGKGIDEIYVVDSGSTDNTESEVIKRRCSFYPASQDPRLSEFPNIRGKGINMWLGQFISKADILLYADGDMKNPSRDVLLRLLFPILARNDVMLVKSIFTRDTILSGNNQIVGGRVTRLTVKPLLQVFFPELSHIIQPINGNIAVRRSAIESMPFGAKYEADLQILINIALQYGTDKITQVFCGSFQQEGQDLESLEIMAYQYIRVILGMAQETGRVSFAYPLSDNFLQVRISGPTIEEYTHPVKTILLPHALQYDDYRQRFITRVTVSSWLPPTPDQLEKPDIIFVAPEMMGRVMEFASKLRGWDPMPPIINFSNLNPDGGLKNLRETYPGKNILMIASPETLSLIDPNLNSSSQVLITRNSVGDYVVDYKQ